MIQVTRSDLPDREFYNRLLDEIWESAYLTNYGPFAQRLEFALAEKLGVEHVVVVQNGTLGLMIALAEAGLPPGAEVVTSPFSFVATVAAIAWQGFRPVFADVDPNTFNLDLTSAERVVGADTAAILPVHVFGNPCELESAEQLAQEHGLELIYDAAHALAVRRRGQPVVMAGRSSVLSFHATKLFHTIEGGAIVAHSEQQARRLRSLASFGMIGGDVENVEDVGINAKMNEFQAAMGLANLAQLEGYIAARRLRTECYRESLVGLPLRHQVLGVTAEEYNYAYMPVVFDMPEHRQRAEDALLARGIRARRYFYPALHQLKAYQKARRRELPNAERLAGCILCLPLYPALPLDDVERVSSIVRRALV